MDSTTIRPPPRRASRPRRRSLDFISKMPLDILIEIIAHLPPIDLLILARTSKDFRGFLMKRSSAPFWKAARLNVRGLPPCPSDLSEPAYANLMFHPYCEICSEEAKVCEWACRVWLCAECFYKNTKIIDDLHLANGLTIRVADVLPAMQDYGKKNFYRPHVEKLIEAIESRTYDQQEKFLAEQQKLLAELNYTALSLESWYKQYEQDMEKQRVELCNKRVQAILTKLSELGYQPELDFMVGAPLEEFKRSWVLNQPCALTPDIWMAIKDPVLRTMERYRNERMTTLRLQALRDRLTITEEIILQLCPKFQHQSLSVTEVVLCIPEVFKLMDLSVPIFPRSQMEEILGTALPPFTERRMQRARQYFGQLVRDIIQIDSGVDPISLAVGAYFACEKCNHTDTFPNVLKSHRCENWLSFEDDELGKAMWQLFGIQTGWRLENYRACVRLEQYIRVYGLNPETATAEDMDQINIRMICRQHIGGDDGQLVKFYSWRCAAFQLSDECAKCSLERAPEDLATAAMQVETTRLGVYKKIHDSERLGWKCARCGLRPVHGDLKTSVRTHLQKVHGILEPEEDDFIASNTLSSCWHLYERLGWVGLIPKRFEGSTLLTEPTTHAINRYHAAFYDFKAYS